MKIYTTFAILFFIASPVFAKESINSYKKLEELYKATYPYRLPKLEYSYKALEPAIDEETMELHYSKHHQAYIDKLNEALKEHPALQKKTLKELLLHSDILPDTIRKKVHNNGGGHFNHSFFWRCMAPDGGGEPQGILKKAITKKFGSFKKFKELFSDTAQAVFGSGWVWLCTDPQGSLVLFTTANQGIPDSVLIPLLCLDVWEHAYYLKYHNKRAEYIAAWWNIVNWKEGEQLYKAVTESIS